MRDDFKKATVKKLAERAAYFCSNPYCKRVTIGPDIANLQKSATVGKAAHICAAAKGGPRYDETQTSAERQNISNGIWLCGSCADLIDKNKGDAYPRDLLMWWKKSHEALMTICLQGGKHVVLQFLDERPDLSTVSSLLRFMSNKGALRNPHQAERLDYVIESIKEMRTYLVALRSQIQADSLLDLIVESMADACRHFMNSTPPDTDYRRWNVALEVFRKAIGINLGRISQEYKVQVPGGLRDIVPESA